MKSRWQHSKIIFWYIHAEDGEKVENAIQLLHNNQ